MFVAVSSKTNFESQPEMIFWMETDLSIWARTEKIIRFLPDLRVWAHPDINIRMELFSSKINI
jgi:hypothetical protein